MALLAATGISLCSINAGACPEDSIAVDGLAEVTVSSGANPLMVSVTVPSEVEGRSDLMLILHFADESADLGSVELATTRSSEKSHADFALDANLLAHSVLVAHYSSIQESDLPAICSEVALR